jgi:hypothetical protein
MSITKHFFGYGVIFVEALEFEVVEMLFTDFETK